MSGLPNGVEHVQVSEGYCHAEFQTKILHNQPTYKIFAGARSSLYPDAGVAIQVTIIQTLN